MSIRNIIRDLNDLKFSYSGRDLGRIESAIDSLRAVEHSAESFNEHRGTPYQYERAGSDSYYAGYGRSNSDRTVDGCPECVPGRPCYGHGH
jgi:hypothetical protein